MNTRGAGGVNSYMYDVEFRSPIESDRLNDAFRDIVDDMGEAWSRADHINNRISSFRSDMSYQIQQIQTNMAHTDGLLEAAHDAYEANSPGVLYWSAYDIIYPATGVASRHDPVMGEVTLPWTTSWTKIPLYKNEYGEYVTSADSSIQIDDGAGLKTKSIPHDSYDMIDNNPETAWVAAYPVASAPAHVTAVITLPEVFSTYLNSVAISPFPAGGCTVKTLKYYDPTLGGYVDVPGFKETSYARRYHFRRINSPGGTTIKFTMTGTTLYDNDGEQVKVFGMRDIEPSLIDYAQTSTFKVKLEASSSINNITYINVGYDYDTVGGLGTDSSPMSVKITTNEAGTGVPIYSSDHNSHPYDGYLPVGGGSTIWAHFTLNRTWGKTPVIRDITIRYN